VVKKIILESGASTTILIFTKIEHGGTDQGRHPSVGAGNEEEIDRIEKILNL